VHWTLGAEQDQFEMEQKRCVLPMNIRAIRESDSEQFLHLGKSLDQETQFMMLEPGEGTLTIEEQRQRIKSLLPQDNQMIFVAEQDNRLVGFLGAYGGDFKGIAIVHLS
jgi:hypothetical protein